MEVQLSVTQTIYTGLFGSQNDVTVSTNACQ